MTRTVPEPGRSAHLLDGARPRRKVLVLAPDLDAVSGVSTHVRQLLSSSLADDHDFALFRTGSEGRAAESRRAKLRRAVASPFALGRTLIRTTPDIVYVNSALEPKAFWRDAAYLMVTKALRRPSVMEVHGGFPPAQIAGPSRLGRAVVRQILRLPDRIVLLASGEVEEYDSFVTGLPLTVIPNAVEVPDTVATPRPVDDGPLKLAYLGRLVRPKGIFEAVEAVRILAERGICCEFAVAGSGPDEDELAAAVDTAGVGDRVNLLGPLSGEAKTDLLDASDVLVFPTYHREGLPYALLEAMAAGLVPVTTAVGGMADVLRPDADGGSAYGLLVPAQDPIAVADALQRLDNDRAAAREISAAAQRRVREAYRIPVMAEAFRRLFDRM